MEPPEARVRGASALEDWDESLAGLEFENHAQIFLHGSLYARWQRAGVLGEETTVEGEKLRDIHDRIAREARRARGQ